MKDINGWEIVSMYSTKKAVDDGFLVKVDSKASKEAGIKFPVYLTRSVWNKYPSCCAKCQTRLPKGTVAYYWPRTQTLLCYGCGEPEYHSFLSAIADEDVYAGNGNPL